MFLGTRERFSEDGKNNTNTVKRRENSEKDLSNLSRLAWTGAKYLGEASVGLNASHSKIPGLLGI